MNLDKNKIVFVVPPISLEEIYGGLAKVGAVSPPINLLLLAAVVREKGFDPAILDCPAHGSDYNGVLAKLKTQAPQYVGITAMTPHIMQANKLAELIKKEIPGIVIILGGAHMNAVPEQTMERFPAIDIGAVGESENSLPELLKALNDGKPASSVAGFIVRENGIIYTGARREKITLDDLPFYAWDILEGYPHVYRSPLFATHRTPATPIITSRGCPAHCTFCYSGGHNTLATHSPEYIVRVLKHLKARHGIREFQIFDDNFTMFKKNLNSLLDQIIAAHLDMTWSCNARVDMVDEEMLARMARAGCWHISFGIETGNQKIMDSLEKKISKEKVARAAGWSRKAGIRTVGYFMIGHFGETEETIEETIDFAIEIGLDDFRMSFFTPLPGTPSFKVAEKYGEFDKNDWGAMTLFAPVFIPAGMTKERLVEAHKRAIRKFFFRPRIIAGYLKMVKNPFMAIKGALGLCHYILTNGKREASRQKNTVHASPDRFKSGVPVL